MKRDIVNAPPGAGGRERPLVLPQLREKVDQRAAFRAEAVTREQLDEARYELAWTEGATLSIDHAVAKAVELATTLGAGIGPPVERGAPPPEPAAAVPTAELASLTAREREVLRELMVGASSREISERLGISLRTEATHIGNILGKLGRGIARGGSGLRLPSPVHVGRISLAAPSLRALADDEVV
jgi:DNA-binding CsgD family transcriptional regulator